MRDYTAAQLRVMDLIYAKGYQGPCGHHGHEMTVDRIGVVRCWGVLEERHDHRANPEPAAWSPDAHTPACYVRHCGAQFWPIPLVELRRAGRPGTP